MATNKYIGSRYVPKYFGTWNSATEYEALSIVSDAQGVYTYTSKRPVPAGTLLSNTEYWAQSGTLSESMQMGIVAHVDSTKADDATISANKLNITFASDYTMNDSTEKALNLDDTIQSGTYGINPSLCSNVPNDLSLTSDTCQLFVYVLGADKYTQTIVCHEQGKQFARMYDQVWTNWEMVGFTPSYATKVSAGLIQLGDGLKAENATGLTTIDHDGSLDIDSQNKLTVTPASKTQLGGVIIGNGINVSNGTISVDSSGSDSWVNVTKEFITSNTRSFRAYRNKNKTFLKLHIVANETIPKNTGYSTLNNPPVVSGFSENEYNNLVSGIYTVNCGSEQDGCYIAGYSAGKKSDNVWQVTFGSINVIKAPTVIGSYVVWDILLPIIY